MPALAIVSPDLLAPAAPKSAPSPNTGNEGFASHLKNASGQQAAASTSPAGAAQKHPRGPRTHDAPQPQGAKKINSPQLKGASAGVPAVPANPNGEASTAAQHPEPAVQVDAKTDTALQESMQVNPLTIGLQHRESVVGRLLADLTTSVTAGTGHDPRANISTQTPQLTVQQSTLQMTGQQANQQPAPQSTPVQLTGESAGAAAPAATPAIETPAVKTPVIKMPAVKMPANQATAAPAADADAPVVHRANPGAPAATTAAIASVIAGLTANQATPAAKQPQMTITVAAAGPQATESADAAALAPSAPAATAPAAAPAPDAQAQAAASMVVQNEYGQIITIHQGKHREEKGEDDSFASTTTTSEKQPIDVNGNYIRSHLPKDHADNATKSEKDSQTDSASQAAKQQEQAPAAEAVKPAAAGEQPSPQKTEPVMNQEPVQLAAAIQPQSTGQSTSVSTPIASVAMHLPSGMTVPDGTVVDQMIAHFSANKLMGDSTINLRLYPEELGELRMEIKVAQDNIKAHIVVQNPQAQEMIDRNLPRLREALEQHGLQLQQVEVLVGAHGQTGGERFQENNAWRQQASSPGSHVNNQSDFTQEIEEIAGDDSTTGTLSVLV
ncbi:MAG: flagellar hook-length control protein FliK [Desulfobulbus sp.]|nr:flagellar hook-length control protein FliK [Desulfobulbus sp.]